MCQNNNILVIVAIMMIVIMIRIMTLKGAIRYFSQSPHCSANCLQHVCSSSQGATVCKQCATHQTVYHMQHVMCHMF